METKALIQDLPTWQTMLVNHYQTFASINQGGRIGLMAKEDFDKMKGTILLWQIQAEQVVAANTEFTGFRTSGIDLLFVLDQGSLSRLHQMASNGQVIHEFEEALRKGEILFYAIKSKPELLKQGYEDFLEGVGLPFLGGCQ